MAASFTATPSQQGGRISPTFNITVRQYYAGTPGDQSLKPGKGCLESIAMQAGGAVTFVASDMKCQLVQGIRIIIGDLAEGIHSGFELVNVNFHCNGTQPSVSMSTNLNGTLSI